jgi:hypothetical protein
MSILCNNIKLMPSHLSHSITHPTINIKLIGKKINFTFDFKKIQNSVWTQKMIKSR